MKTVIFDLDGTLVHTAPDLMDSLNFVLTRYGLQPVGDDQVSGLIGQGSMTMLRRGFNLRGYQCDTKGLDLAHDMLVEHYRNSMPGKSTPYPGVLSALERLSSAHYQLAVCTNKNEDLARQLIEKLNLTGRFAAIIGGDTFGIKKPDGALLQRTIEQVGGDPASSVMIGDSRNDIEAAQNAGIRSICVSFGYSDAPVASLKPDAVIDCFDELTVALLEQLLEAHWQDKHLIYNWHDARPG